MKIIIKTSMYMHGKYIYIYITFSMFDTFWHAICMYISQICHNIAHFISYIIYMFILELHPNLTALVGAALHFTAEEKMCSLVQLDLLMVFFPMETENRKIGILGNRNMIFPNFPNDILLKIHYGILGTSEKGIIWVFLG